MFVLLGDIVAIGYARSDDVKEGEDEGLGIVNDSAAELGKVAPAGGAGISDGGNAVWDGDDVGRDGEVAVAPGIVAKSCEGVNVDIDEPGSEAETGNINGFFAVFAGIDDSMAAILPSRMATSYFVSTLFFGSRTWPLELVDRIVQRMTKLNAAIAEDQAN